MKRDRTFLLRFSILLALLLGFLFSAESFAGTVDTDFSAIVTKLNDWPPAHSGPGACACHLCCRRRHGYRPTVRHRRRRGGRGCADLELRPADHHRDHCGRCLILADWLAFGRPRRFGRGFLLQYAIPDHYAAWRLFRKSCRWHPRHFANCSQNRPRMVSRCS